MEQLYYPVPVLQTATESTRTCRPRYHRYYYHRNHYHYITLLVFFVRFFIFYSGLVCLFCYCSAWTIFFRKV